MNNDSFLPQRGNYRNLIVYKKTECIYDITFHFAHRFLRAGDRTIDQMIQAARSGKQNIAEGSAASSTSSETEIKLMNVAKASLKELLVDYEDYLRVRSLRQWERNDEIYVKSREICARHNDSAFFMTDIDRRSDEAIANLAIILIGQADYLLFKLIEQLKEKFVISDGIKEQMHRARTGYRQQETEELARLRSMVPQLQQEVTRLQALLTEHGIAF